VVRLRQTSDKSADIARLHELVATVRQFPGEDEIRLSIVNGSSITYMKLTALYAGYCPELHERLAALVDEGDFSVEE
jgi:hypothetical protein